MPKFFLPPEEMQDNFMVLTGEQYQHAKVLRLKNGDAVSVCDGRGTDCRCVVSDVSEGRISLVVQSRDVSLAEPTVQATVYMAFPKSDKLEHVIQKTTELGVHAIQPVAMERCVVKLEGKDAGKKVERWQKIAREAVKQCARVTVPEVLPPKKLTQLEEELKQLDVLIVPWEDARDGSIRRALAPFEGREALRVGILIGPEGGISGQEAHWLAENAGAKLVTLGPRILRTETAGLCALTMVMAFRGEME